jgi:FKBP-type peptidyl-prolyl cis-trans isomerase SlyD
MSDEPEAESAEADEEVTERTEAPDESDAAPETDAEQGTDAAADEAAAAGDVGEDEDGDGEESEPESESDAEDGIEDGDFVRLDYTVRTVEDGTVVDTTLEDVADEAGLGDENYEFEPRVVVIGAGHLFQGVDENLVGAGEGDTGTVTIPAAEAFGEFDPEDVRTVSADRIDEDDRYPGAQVSIDGEQGRVETIIGGRARVDFNHPLAGEDLEYEYEILDVVEDRVERARGLLGMYLQEVPELSIEVDEVEEERVVDVEPDADADADEDDGDGAAEADEDDDGLAEPETEMVTEVVEKETLYIEATPQMTMNQQWLFSKQQIAQDLMNRLDLDRVVVRETIEGGMGMGMGGMMGGMGGGAPAPAPSGDDVEDALDDVDIDADEIVEELDTEE